MGIEIKTVSASVNDSKSITFSNTVLAYTVGIAKWTFSYGDDDHHIHQLSLDLQSNSSGSSVSVKVNATLADSSGNHINDSDSSVDLVCIAVTGNANTNVALTNENSVQNGGKSAAIPLPGGGNTNITVASLAGFDLAYDSGDDHHLETMGIGAGTSTSGTSGFVTGSAKMYDDSGNSAATATINGSFVAQAAGSPTLIAKQYDNVQSSAVTTWDTGKNITAAGAMMNSMVVSFGSDDHHVKTISGGVGAVSFKGTAVAIKGAEATLSDDSGHKQDNNDSHVSYTVFALTSS